MWLITIKICSKPWGNNLKQNFIVIKPFPNLILKKNRNLPSSKSNLKQEEKVKSKPLIIFGFILSLTSIFLLLFTINNKFG